jgi:hypothetical protein
MGGEKLNNSDFYGVELFNGGLVAFEDRIVFSDENDRDFKTHNDMSFS